MNATFEHQKIVPHIRWMIRRDRPEVLAIETVSFDDPWDDDDFSRCLRQWNCVPMVAEHDERVIGFMIYALHEHRIELLNFAVHDQFRRLGVGSGMIGRLKAKLRGARKQIVADVWERNLPAQLFFRSCQFWAMRPVCGTLGNGEDEYRFVFREAG